MRELAGRYPWFDGAVIAAAGGERDALPVHILLLKDFRPSFMLHRARATTESGADEPTVAECIAEPADALAVTDASACETKPAMMDIIDDFIVKGEHKVKATDDTPEFLPGNAADDLPDDDFITEELAEVYLDQGLFDQAKSIYERLSLLYPKKSVYFAEIIEKASRGESADGDTENQETIK